MYMYLMRVSVRCAHAFSAGLHCVLIVVNLECKLTPLFALWNALVFAGQCNQSTRMAHLRLVHTTGHDNLHVRYTT